MRRVDAEQVFVLQFVAVKLAKDPDLARGAAEGIVLQAKDVWAQLQRNAGEDWWVDD